MAEFTPEITDKQPRTTAKGTWLLNESLNAVDGGPDFSLTGTFNNCYTGSMQEFALSTIHLPENFMYLEHYNSTLGVHVYTRYYSSASSNSLSGEYVISQFVTKKEFTDKTGEDGIKLRTFTITGGADVTSTDLIN